jgi:predicted O-methyltransferase YrrM
MTTRGQAQSESGDALRVLARSTRTLIRQARARYTTDLLCRPYRHDFASVWTTVDLVPGWFNEGSAALLYGLMRERPPATVVEIGSYLGRSTVFFGLTLKHLGGRGRVVAIDPHTGDRQHLEGFAVDRLPSYELFRHHCRAAGVVDVVDAQVARSLEAAERWSGPIDLLYVDGWHSYDAVVADGEAWLPHLSDGGVVLFDDYVAYEEVRRGVADLAERGVFHLWGSVFGQALGGASPEPPPAGERALRLGGALNLVRRTPS